MFQDFHQVLMNSNRLTAVIVDSIQTISAVSEQLSAHAAETTNTEDANMKILESINTRMHSLIDTIKHNNQ